MSNDDLEKIHAKLFSQDTVLAQNAQDTTNPLEIIQAIPVDVMVELGRARMSLQQLVDLGQGGVIELNNAADGLLIVSANGIPVAEGEVVVVNNRFGVRLSRILSAAERVSKS